MINDKRQMMNDVFFTFRGGIYYFVCLFLNNFQQ